VTLEYKLTPIPGEHRQCEQIAARYFPPQTTLYGISEAVAKELAILPVFLSAGEAIGLIACGRATALASPVPGAPPMFERWNTHVTGPSPDERQYPLVLRMRLVLARVRWWKKRKRAGVTFAKCPIRPLRQADRAEVRWAIRKHNVTAIATIALLRNDVRQLLSAQSARKNSIDRAVRIICAEIAGEHLIAWGRPGNWRNQTLAGRKHERIPSEFFANPHLTIRTDGWATYRPEAPVRERREWAGPDWGDVRFRLNEVRELLRDQTGTQAALLEDEHRASMATARQKLAIPNKPGGGAKKLTAATEAFVRAVQAGRVTWDYLQSMKQKELVNIYAEAARTTLVQAREAALGLLRDAGYPDKAPT